MQCLYEIRIVHSAQQPHTRVLLQDIVGHELFQALARVTRDPAIVSVPDTTVLGLVYAKCRLGCDH